MKTYVSKLMSLKDFNNAMQGSNQVSTKSIYIRDIANNRKEFIEKIESMKPFGYVLDKNCIKEVHRGRDRTLEDIYYYLKEEYKVKDCNFVAVQNEEGKYLMNIFFKHIKNCVYLSYIVLEYSFKVDKNNQIGDINIVLDAEV